MLCHFFMGVGNAVLYVLRAYRCQNIKRRELGKLNTMYDYNNAEQLGNRKPTWNIRGRECNWQYGDTDYFKAFNLSQSLCEKNPKNRKPTSTEHILYPTQFNGTYNELFSPVLHAPWSWYISKFWKWYAASIPNCLPKYTTTSKHYNCVSSPTISL